jgi:DNA-binding NtrC family response regulator
VGSTELRHADVRLVSATHRDLAAMVAQGRFREDLYYRLSTFPIALPPLRERLGDLPLLANALLERLAPGRPLSLDAGAVQQLARYPFPGNVRELRNVLERAVLLTDGDHITAETVDRALSVGLLRRPPRPALPLLPAQAGAEPPAAPPAASLRQTEAQALRAALQAHQGSREALAAALGISVRTLYRKLRALDEDGTSAG